MLFVPRCSCAEDEKLRLRACILAIEFALGALLKLPFNNSCFALSDILIIIDVGTTV